MKLAEEANRGKVRKEIGGKLNPGKLARPALLRGFRPFCEDFGGEGVLIAHCWKAVGEHSESQLLSNPPPIALNSGQSAQLVANVSSKIYIIISLNGKYTVPSLSMENGIFLTSLSNIFCMNGNLF